MAPIKAEMIAKTDTLARILPVLACDINMIRIACRIKQLNRVTRRPILSERKPARIRPPPLPSARIATRTKPSSTLAWILAMAASLLMIISPAPAPQA